MSDETFNPTNELEHARMRQSQQEYLDLRSQNQALQEEVDRLRHVVRHESPDMISCSCGATRHGIAVENQALQERLDRQEVYISKEIPALQERAERAEAQLAALQAGNEVLEDLMDGNDA